MKEKVLETIRNYNLIRPKENILVGVSGGPDSMVLLYLLMELKDDLDFNILVAHVNHGVRGKEARRDQEFVKEQAKKLGLPYFSKKVDMIAYAKAKGISEEEAGRKLRYGFFREVLA
ncbi:MAG TPA: ATP-binding protein, partial [Tissierellaceae bacterium]|nr:ATP-binding protein [Tissierellaceae bacterium]